MKRLAIVTTHPIQYNAPLFRLVALKPEVELLVIYTRNRGAVEHDKEFGQSVVWDIPLTEGYAHQTIDATNQKGKSALIQSIESWQPNALLVYGWNFPGHLSVMRHFYGAVPIWFRGDSHLLDPQPQWKRWVRKAWLTYVYRHVDHVFPVGSANADYYRWAGLEEEQMTMAPHAIENTRFNQKSTPAERALWRSNLGIEDDRPIVLFAGKLVLNKGPLLLLNAWKKIQQETHLLFVGSGELEGVLREEAKATTNVHFAGFLNQSQMPLAYRFSEVFCMPSKNETWGLAINEALASGTPCIVSDRAGCAVDLANSPWVTACSLSDTSNWTRELEMQLQIATRDETWRNEFLKRHSTESFADLISERLLNA